MKKWIKMVIFEISPNGVTPRKYAFSLVELLIVVAILAVLISLLAPSLRTTIYAAKNLKCSHNLKSLIHGWTLYADDNNDFFPPRDDADKRTGISQGDDLNKLQRGMNSGAHQLWSLYPLVRPYFGNRLGPEFVCALYGSHGGNDPKGIPEAFGDPDFGLEHPRTIGGVFAYFDGEGVFDISQSRGFESTYSYWAQYDGGYIRNIPNGKSERLGDPIRFSAEWNQPTTPHTIVPESYLLLSDFAAGNGSKRATSNNSDKVTTTHMPPPGTFYTMNKHGYSHIPTYAHLPGNGTQSFENGIFINNYGYQNGSVKTVTANSNRYLIFETHTFANGLLVPLED